MRRHVLILAAGLLAIAGTEAIAAPCLSDSVETSEATGQLTIGRARDAAGRTARPYILRLAKPVCLDTEDPEEKVAATRTIHVFGTEEAMTSRIAGLVGKTVTVRGRAMAAHTAHHHAPIVMNLSAIAQR